MADNPLFTLSSKGLLYGVGEKADRAFAYYLTSDASQTPLYQNNVRSLQKSVQLYGNDHVKLKSQIEQDLTAIYQGLFDDMQATVTIGDTATDGSNRYNIGIDVVITQNGSDYSLGRELQVFNGVVQDLLNQLNGTPTA